MKQINKVREPRLLLKHRKQRSASFKNLPQKAKDELRQKLVNEQGYICCYCLKRVVDATEAYMKVEHFKSQRHYPKLQLVYSNLFSACLGNEGQLGHLQTCDTKKGMKELIINPLSTNPNCEHLFKYNAEGEISSINDDKEINKAINEVLNLNMDRLKEARREVYLAVQNSFENEKRLLANGTLKLSYLQKEKSKWLQKTDGQFRPFCMVAVYFLNKKIRQINSQKKLI